jgi:excisionase family DNA binding protein
MPSKKKQSSISLISNQPEPLSVTIPQAAALLNTTVRGVRALLWAKKVPHFQVGKRFLIALDELRAFVRRAA